MNTHQVLFLGEVKKLINQRLPGTDLSHFDGSMLPTIVISECKNEHDLRLLNESSAQNPEAAWILLEEALNPNLLGEVLTSGRSLFFLKKGFTSTQWLQILQKAQEIEHQHKNHNQSLEQLREQNRELSLLTESLQGQAFESTQSLQESHQEEKKRYEQTRQWVQILLRMQKVDDFNDMILLLHWVLRTEISDVFLFESMEGQHQVFYTHRNQSYRSDFLWPDKFEFQTTMDRQQQAQLAETLGRPLGRVFRKSISEGASIFEVWFETTHVDFKLDLFINRYTELWNIIKIVADRIQKTESIERSGKIWKEIFNGLQQPLAVLNSRKDVIIANKKFIRSSKKNKKCYQLFAERETACLGCPMDMSSMGQIQTEKDKAIHRVHSMPMGEGLYVHAYENITESQMLYAQLVQSDKLSSIGAMADELARELSQPLFEIQKKSELLQEKVQSLQMEKDLQEVTKAAIRCQDIINSLLDFSKDEHLKKLEIVSLDQVIQKTLPFLKTSLRLHRLQLELNSPKQNLKLQSQLIQQVVFNLVQNACQAMEQPGQLTLRTWSEVSFCYMEIEDTGPGIRPDIQVSLFEPFQTSKKENAGTGLGLYLSKKIIQKFKGDIKLKSSSSGTCFQIKIPCESGLNL